MDSLLASYASSDDEDAAAPAPAPAASKRLSAALPPPKSPAASALFSSLPAPKASAPSSLFSTLPPPKSSPSPSLFSDLPPPKTSQSSSSSSSSLFSFLPPPKPAPPLPTAAPPKSVVKFTPPVPAPIPGADSDDEDTSRKRKPQETSAPKSSSLVLPAPKNTLGLTPALGAARRSALESVPADIAVAEPVPMPVPDAAGYESYGGYEVGPSQPGYSGGGEEGWVQGYAGNWPEEPAVATDPDIADMVRAAGKRARRGVPMEIVEVKQDELMKNRPREDKHKATGIAFGPAYQPVSSGKEKPSKLHKRKHQIGSLYFDMKQKEMELQERRSRGFLTKAETQAKYGW